MTAAGATPKTVFPGLGLGAADVAAIGRGLSIGAGSAPVATFGAGGGGGEGSAPEVTLGAGGAGGATPNSVFCEICAALPNAFPVLGQMRSPGPWSCPQ
jgi:hypothetical protein